VENEWRDLCTAPRDGTIIEIRSTYGVAPWYGLYKWTTTHCSLGVDGGLHQYEAEADWCGVNRLGSVFTESRDFMWRPYQAGNPEQYIDPTNGAQETARYWRQAVAHESGVSLLYLEAVTLKNRCLNWLGDRLFRNRRYHIHRIEDITTRERINHTPDSE